LAESSAGTYEASLNVFERLLQTATARRGDNGARDGIRDAAAGNNLAEATIARHLRHLKAIVRWAKREGLLTVLPEFTMPKRAKGAKMMRGRPITGEEFDRMVQLYPKRLRRARQPPASTS